MSDAVPAMTSAELRDIGQDRFGAEWQRPLARYLGQHYPKGARESIDDRLVRRWAADERPVPPWAAEALRNGPRQTVVSGAPVAYRRMLDALHRIRERSPRATISAALILAEVIEAKGGIDKAELCDRVAGSRDTSSLDASIRHLVELELLTVERPAQNSAIIRLGGFFR